MDSTITLRKTLNSLSFLTLTAIVSCDIGRVTIEVDQRDEFIIDCDEIEKIHMRFKKNEVERIIESLGKITKIMTLDHDTDKENDCFLNSKNKI